MRNTKIFGLHTVDQMSKNPTAFVFTVGIDTLFTVVAFTTGTNTRNQNLIAFFEVWNACSNFLYNPDSFMAKDSSTLTCRDISFDNMKICSTNSSFYNTHNSVSWLANNWFVNINKWSKSWFNISIGFHKAYLRFFICIVYIIIVSLYKKKSKQYVKKITN